MSECRLGVGIIDCGGIANEAHPPNYARNPRVRLVALADIDAARARATAERWGVGPTTRPQSRRRR